MATKNKTTPASTTKQAKKIAPPKQDFTKKAKKGIKGYIKKFFNVRVFIAIVLPYLIAIAMFAMYTFLFNDKKDGIDYGIAKDKAGNYLTYGLDVPYWTNWLMLGAFIPLIMLTLVTHQKNQLTGPYGETILILIPTLVWLLNGQEEIISELMKYSIYLVAGGTGLFIFGSFLKKGTIMRQLVIKIGFIIAAILSTLIISVVLLNWADKTMEWAPAKSVWSETADKEINYGWISAMDINIKDYASREWIIFLAIVTLGSALLLVFIGLASTYEGISIDTTQLVFVSRSKKKKLQAEKALKEEKEKQKKAQEEVKKAQTEAKEAKKEAEKVQKEVVKAQKEAEKAHDEVEKVEQEVKEAQQEIKVAQTEAVKVKKEAEKVQKEAEKIQENTKKEKKNIKKNK